MWKKITDTVQSHIAFLCIFSFRWLATTNSSAQILFNLYLIERKKVNVKREALRVRVNHIARSDTEKYFSFGDRISDLAFYFHFKWFSAPIIQQRRRQQSAKKHERVELQSESWLIVCEKRLSNLWFSWGLTKEKKRNKVVKIEKYNKNVIKNDEKVQTQKCKKLEEKLKWEKWKFSALFSRRSRSPPQVTIKFSICSRVWENPNFHLVYRIINCVSMKSFKI